MLATPASMSLSELRRFLDAEPFRAFQVHTRQEALCVHDPRQVAVAASGQVLVIVADAARIVPLPIADLVRVEPVTENALPPKFELPVYLVQAARAVAGLVPQAETEPVGVEPTAPGAPPADPGRVEFVGFSGADGVFVVHAAVSDAAGRALFDCSDTRWSVHGVEAFENGTSLYLHHLDHPTEEQRVILWPGKNGTFDSYAEAVSFSKLHAELVARDKRLRRRPPRPREPSKAWIRSIAIAWDKPFVDGKAEAFGDRETDEDTGRYQLELEPLEIGPNQWVQNPRILDTRHESVVFGLVGTPWDFEISDVRSDTVWSFSLRCWPHAGNDLRLTVDLRRRTATVAGDDVELPLAFIERHLVNFALYESWAAMEASLRAGPHPADRPDVTFALSGGYHVEWWAGQRVQGTPFLQPRIFAPDGTTLLDFRATGWAARLAGGAERPVLSLRFVSDERVGACEAAAHEVLIDLVARRVIARGLEGSTSLGMLQKLVRDVRGAKWMNEALAALLTKGRGVPVPLIEW